MIWISFGLAGAEGAFSTRRAGVSAGRYASLNLGNGTDDDLDLVRANQERFRSAIKRDSCDLVMVKQVHGNKVLEARAASCEPSDGDPSGCHEADGLITDEKKRTLLALTADCFPVALVTSKTVAMIHCGWRGVCAGIVNVGLRESLKVSCKRAEEVVAFIGPGIGSCCYEIGEDVVYEISKLGYSDEVLGRSRLDLGEVVRRELMESGVLQRNIHSVGLCTSCNDELFFSYRRDGSTGRQGGYVWLV